MIDSEVSRLEFGKIQNANPMFYLEGVSLDDKARLVSYRDFIMTRIPIVLAALYRYDT